MAEEAGSSTEAVQAKQAALSIRHSAVADADRTLAASVARAHAGAAAAIARLDAIAAEVEIARIRPCWASIRLWVRGPFTRS
jgi:hypothetical protein